MAIQKDIIQNYIILYYKGVICLSRTITYSGKKILEKHSVLHLYRHTGVLQPVFPSTSQRFQLLPASPPHLLEAPGTLIANSTDIEEIRGGANDA